MTDEEISLLLEGADSERRGLEFKEAFSWSDNDANAWIREKSIRAILGLTNIPTGGRLVIGVKEENGKPRITGLTSDQLSSFEAFDSIKGVVDGFSSVGTSFEILCGEYKSQDNCIHTVAVFAVNEFDEYPAVCKKNGQSSGTLVKDDIYTRAKIGAAATIKATDAELREMIRMAADKEKISLTKRGYTRDQANSVYDEQIEDLEDQ